MKRIVLVLSTLTALVVLSADQRAAVAQYRMTSANPARSVRNYLYSRPTVSPYLNLTSRDANVGMPSYFTQVRPLVEQREEAVARQRQTAQMQAQLNQVQTQVRQSQQDAASMMITGRVGWSARGYPRFGTYMSFYPGFQRIPR